MLLTDWLKIATAGPTIDGRELKPDVLKSMAKTYSPETRIASVNGEHWELPGLGTVQELKTAKDDQGRLSLFARINPKAEMVARIERGKGVFFSVEIRSGFPAEGDFYLSGLAMTDEPASQGLIPTKFSAEKGNGEIFLNTAKPEEDAFTAQEEPPDWFRRFMAPVFRALNIHQDEDPMTKEQQAKFDALTESVAKLAAQVGSLTEKPAAKEEAAKEGGDFAAKFADLSKRIETLAASVGTLKAPGAGEQAKGKESAGTFADQVEKLGEKITGLEATLAEYTAFMAETKATEALPVTEGTDAAGIW